MADRARHAEARALRRQEAVGALAAVEDPIDEEDLNDNEEMAAPVRVPQRSGPALAPPLALDPGMCVLNMVNMNLIFGN